MAVISTTTYLYVDSSLNPYYVQGSQLVDRGAWSSAAFYNLHDVIQIGINQYIALQPNSNTPPTSIVDDNWSTLVVVEEQNGTSTSAGSDAYARALAEQALELAYTGTQAFSIAISAYALAQIGTNTGTAAYNLALGASTAASSAFTIAVAGTNAAASAQSTANGAFSIAVIGTNAAASAQSTADAAYALAQIGTNAIFSAGNAYALAQIGTNTGSYAVAYAVPAYTLAQIGTNTGSLAYAIAVAAYNLAVIGTNTGGGGGTEAYVLAQIGTNTGTAALNAAASAQATANSAFSIAVIGTNAAASAQATANSAYALAQIGTNTGTAALTAAASAQATANSAFSIAIIGTNAAASAQSTANSGYALAQIGTNTGSTAYSVAQSAYALAQTGTHVSRSIVLCAAYTPPLAGADNAEILVPYAYDGTTSLSWGVKRASLRVQTAGTTSQVVIQKSTSSGPFVAEAIGTVTLPAGSYESSTITALGTTDSGNKLRFYVDTLGTAQNWTVQVDISYPQ